jgi:hypothetical protein
MFDSITKGARPMTFAGLTNAQWEAIHSTHHWPDGTNWRSLIEQAGRRVWERWAEREIWLVENLRGKPPTEQRKKVEAVLRLTRKLQKAWADTSLDEADLPDPGLKLREQRAEVWLYHYGSHVSPFTSQRDPIQDDLEWQLISIWIEAGGELSYSRYPEKKPPLKERRYRRPGQQEPARADSEFAEEPGTPGGPLIDFLTVALEAILGKTYQPSGIADIIDSHRPEIAKARGIRRREHGD